MKRFFVLSILLLIIVSGLMFYIYHSRKTTRSQIIGVRALLESDIELEFKKFMDTIEMRKALETFKKLPLNEETQKSFHILTGEIEDNICYFTTGKLLEYRYKNHIKNVLDNALKKIQEIKDENTRQSLNEIFENTTLIMIKNHVDDLNSLKNDAQQFAQKKGLIFDPTIGYISYYINKISSDLESQIKEIEIIQAMLDKLPKDKQAAQQVMYKIAFKIKRDIQGLTIGFMIVRSIKEQLELLFKKTIEIQDEKARTSLQKQIDQQLQHAEELIKQFEALRKNAQNVAKERNLKYEEPMID